MQTNEFVVGKWYKNLSWSISLAAKLESFDDVTLRFTEYVTNYGRYIIYNFSNYRSSQFEEVSLDKIYEVLPDKHPDKIIINNNNHVESLIKLINNV